MSVSIFQESHLLIYYFLPFSEPSSRLLYWSCGVEPCCPRTFIIHPGYCIGLVVWNLAVLGHSSIHPGYCISLVVRNLAVVGHSLFIQATVSCGEEPCCPRTFIIDPGYCIGLVVRNLAVLGHSSLIQATVLVLWCGTLLS